jgi:uncharacterized membrane protein
MKLFFTAYGSALFAMLVIDGIWLSTMIKPFYAKHLGSLMSAHPSFGAAGVFYAIYVLGITTLVVLPAVTHGTPTWHVLGYGALLGLTAYATYDLTNQATLRDWPAVITVVDLIWGTVLTGAVSVIAVSIVRFFKV